MISFIRFFNRIYFPLLDIFSNKALRLGPIWSGCISQRWVFRASLVLNFSSHTLQRKGALTTSWTDLSLVLPAPAHTVLLISSRHSVTWHTRGDQWHSVGKRDKWPVVTCLKEESLMSIYVSLNTKEENSIHKKRKCNEEIFCQAGDPSTGHESGLSHFNHHFDSDRVISSD